MTEPVSGLSRGVVLAALCTAAGILPGVLGLNGDAMPTAAVRSLGWPAFGLVAAVLLDREPRSRLGRSLAALAVVPVVVALVAHGSGWEQLERWWERLGLAPILVALALIAWCFDRPADRMARRRLIWLVVWSAGLVAAIVLAGAGASPRTQAAVTTLGLWTMAAVVFRLATVRELRPIDEPLIDLAIGAATVVCGAGVGTAIRIAATRLHLPAPELSGGFAAVVTTALVLPAGLWVRRLFLQRRYGRGTLSTADVAQITAGLHSLTDARELLGKAAAMVAAASGHRRVGLVLGPDAPEAPVRYPLVVGGDRVGTLFVEVEPDHPEGPEPRQQRTVAQLLPTVALVAKAVSLAVEADHARRDVARQRDAERARILGDLHDGLGPALVGMSLRVRAELRRRPPPATLLETLAGELAACRADLRRIVNGLTPSVLADGDLATALEALGGEFDGFTVTTEVAELGEISADLAAAVYRSVAEGVTNALRHARDAGKVTVTVARHDRAIVAEVADDGRSGPIVWGVGLTSLRRRAGELGGTLEITTADTGTRLRLELPT